MSIITKTLIASVLIAMFIFVGCVTTQSLADRSAELAERIIRETQEAGAEAETKEIENVIHAASGWVNGPGGRANGQERYQAPPGWNIREVKTHYIKRHGTAGSSHSLLSEGGVHVEIYDDLHRQLEESSQNESATKAGLEYGIDSSSRRLSEYIKEFTSASTQNRNTLNIRWHAHGACKAKILGQCVDRRHAELEVRYDVVIEKTATPSVDFTQEYLALINRFYTNYLDDQ